MDKNETNKVMSELSDDVVLDEAVKRLRTMYQRKVGKDHHYETIFVLKVTYDDSYKIEISRRSDFYRSQPSLKILATES